MTTLSGVGYTYIGELRIGILSPIIPVCRSPPLLPLSFFLFSPALTGAPFLSHAVHLWGHRGLSPGDLCFIQYFPLLLSFLFFLF